VDGPDQRPHGADGQNRKSADQSGARLPLLRGKAGQRPELGAALFRQAPGPEVKHGATLKEERNE